MTVLLSSSRKRPHALAVATRPDVQKDDPRHPDHRPPSAPQGVNAAADGRRDPRRLTHSLSLSLAFVPFRARAARSLARRLSRLRRLAASTTRSTRRRARRSGAASPRRAAAALAMAAMTAMTVVVWRRRIDPVPSSLRLNVSSSLPKRRRVTTMSPPPTVDLSLSLSLQGGPHRRGRAPAAARRTPVAARRAARGQ